MENKILFLNKKKIHNFFLNKKKKTSHETLYNSDNGKLISGYIPTDNDRNYFYTHICHHTMKKSLELLLKNNNNNNNINNNNIIVETGCSTHQGTKSTKLWDRFVNSYGGNVYSVDLDNKAVTLTNSVTTDKTLVTCSDSVEYLKTFTQPIDLLYLDSYDVDFSNPLPSATHHLNEFNAVKNLLHKGSIVLIDDTPLSSDWYDDAYSIPIDSPRRTNFLPEMSGKGSLVNIELEKMNATKILHQYQVLWVIN